MSDTFNRSRERIGKEPETIADSLFNYPSLERLFAEPNDTNALVGMRARLDSTIKQLDRVIRQGTPADARRATAVMCAYDATLTLLAELEKRHHSAS